MQPYRTADNVIDGVVLTFADVTERVNALAMRKARDLARSIVDTVPTPLVVLNGDLEISSTNLAFCKTFALQAADIVGKPFFEAGGGMWDAPAMRKLLQEVLPHERGFAPCELQHTSASMAAHRLRVAARRIADQPSDGEQLVLLSIEPLPDNPS